MIQELLIKFEYNENFPKEDRCIAWIENTEYRGTIVSSYTQGSCLRELGISLMFKEQCEKYKDDLINIKNESKNQENSSSSYHPPV